MSKRIVLATLGSLGDIHPYMAIALGLQARGHQVAIATSEVYRSKLAAAGLEFHPVRPNLSPDDKALNKLVMDARRGTEHVLRRVVLPHLRASYDDLTKAVQGADLLVTHPLTFAGPIIAEKMGIAWVSSVLSPISFFSADDLSVLAPFPALANLRALGPAVNRAILRIGKSTTYSWSEPVRQLRAELGLPAGENPLFEGQHSPDLVLALFSSVLATPQPDWPPQTQITGFAFYDNQPGSEGLSPELQQFLDSGPPPIVFTLGSSAVLDAGNFYVHSAAVAQQLGCRAVLLVGSDPANLPAPLPKDVTAFAYAPYSELFPHAAAVVHQGGVGTTAQVLRSGRPMLVVPYSHDQPDNAARVVRLGVGRTVGRYRYSVQRAAQELKQLLDDPGYAATATTIGHRVQAEEGVRVACDAIEELRVPSRLF